MRWFALLLVSVLSAGRGMDTDFSYLGLNETVSVSGDAAAASSIRCHAAKSGLALSIRCDRGVIKITRVSNRRARVGKYEFWRMSVGDNAFFPSEPKGAQSPPAVAARVYSQSHPEYKFAARAEGGGVRLWRLGPGYPKIRKPVKEKPETMRRKKYPFTYMQIADVVSYQRMGGAASLALSALSLVDDRKFTTRERDGWLEIERIA